MARPIVVLLLVVAFGVYCVAALNLTPSPILTQSLVSVPVPYFGFTGAAMSVSASSDTFVLAVPGGIPAEDRLEAAGVLVIGKRRDQNEWLERDMFTISSPIGSRSDFAQFVSTSGSLILVSDKSDSGDFVVHVLRSGSADLINAVNVGATWVYTNIALTGVSPSSVKAIHLQGDIGTGGLIAIATDIEGDVSVWLAEFGASVPAPTLQEIPQAVTCVDSARFIRLAGANNIVFMTIGSPVPNANCGCIYANTIGVGTPVGSYCDHVTVGFGSSISTYNRLDEQGLSLGNSIAVAGRSVDWPLITLSYDYGIFAFVAQFTTPRHVGTASRGVGFSKVVHTKLLTAAMTLRNNAPAGQVISTYAPSMDQIQRWDGFSVDCEQFATAGNPLTSGQGMDFALSPTSDTLVALACVPTGAAGPRRMVLAIMSTRSNPFA